MPRLRLLFLCGLPPALASFTPRRLQDFDVGPSSSGKPGMRRFEHNEAHRLSDGGEIVLSWSMDANPETILSLDTESPQVKLVECEPEHVVIEIPENRMEESAKWHYIVSSSDVHACQGELEDEHLYLRILGDAMPGGVPRPGVRLVAFDVEQLSGHQHVAEHTEFFFHYAPAEAKDLSIGRVSHRNPSAESRELSAVITSGQPVFTSGFSGGIQKTKSIFNFVPKQVSNFGWNWDWTSNVSKNPEYMYNFTGGKGYMKFTEPFVQAHASIMINFTSHFEDLQKAPLINLITTLEGHATMSGDVAAVVDVKDDSDGDPFNHIDIPIFGDLQDTQWLGKLKFYLGNIIVELTPGVQFKAEAYHVGRFKGSLKVGLSAQCTMKAVLHFDSKIGLDTNFTTDLVDVQLWPPTWLIWAKHFEMGVLLEPHLWVKGRFGDVKNSKLGMAVKPYVNLTLSQTGPLGSLAEIETRRLAIYPFRCSGAQPGKEYSVRITANGYTRSSSVQLSLSGVVEYNNHVQKYLFGRLSEHDLLENPIKVEILEDGKEPPKAVTDIYCNALVNGACTPSPLQAKLLVEGKEITCQLTAIWQEEPLPWLVSKIRSVGVGIPTIALTKAVSNQYLASNGDVMFRLIRNGRSFEAKMDVNASDPTRIVVSSSKTYELGTSFIESWKHFTPPATLSKAQQQVPTSPKVQLVQGDNVLGENDMPEIPWDQAGVRPLWQMYQGGLDEGTGAIPVDLALYSTSMKSLTIGTGQMMITVQDPAHASFWIYPYQSAKINPGKLMTYYWTVEAPMQTPIDFKLGALEVQIETDYALGKLSKFKPIVGAPFPMPITQSKCQYSAQELTKYKNYANPCSFSAKLSVPDKLAGKKIMLKLEWKMGGRNHEMISAPIDVVAKKRRLLQIVEPQEGEVFSRRGAARHLDVAWSIEDDNDAEADAEQARQLAMHGLPAPRPEPKELPRRLSVSVARAGGETVFSREGVHALDWRARVRGGVVQQWEDGKYEVTLRHSSSAGTFEERRNIVLCSDCEDTPIEKRTSQASRTRRLVATAHHEMLRSYLDPKDHERRLQALSWSPTAINFNNKMTEFNPNCAEKPLQYALGCGMFAEGEFRHLELPGNFPVIGGLIEAPDYSTGYMPITGVQVDEKLSELLPPEFCAGGVCSGVLPGCPPPSVNKIQIPKIEFQLSRKFHWTQDTLKGTQEVVAYALALVPELIAITLKDLNVSSLTEDMVWKTRRLEGDLPSSSEFSVHIGQDIPYQVDEDLVRELVNRNSFRGFRDGHEKELGPATISRFSVIRPDSAPLYPESRQMPVLVVALCACAATLSLVVCVMRRQKFVPSYSAVDGEATA